MDVVVAVGERYPEPRLGQRVEHIPGPPSGDRLLYEGSSEESQTHLHPDRKFSSTRGLPLTARGQGHQ